MSNLADTDADRPFVDWPRPLAFVLSGGGAFGSVQVGMIRALLERGVRPDLIVGSSIGALHGGLLATDPDCAVEVMESLWDGMSRRALFGRRRDVAGSLLLRRRLSSAVRLETLIGANIGVTRFSELTIPFAAIVTDAITGRPRAIDAGPLRPALLASAAVPGVFPEVEIDGRPFVDGGVSANVPVRQAVTLGAASVVALDATPPVISDRFPSGLVASLIHSVGLMLRNQRSAVVEDLGPDPPIAVLPSAVPPGMGTFDFTLTDRLIADGYALTGATLDAWARGEAAPIAPDRALHRGPAGRPGG